MSGDVRFWVQRYISEGFGRVHPIPHGEKGPRVKGWQDPKSTFALDVWSEDDNVGTALVGDLVDIDLDSPEAVACAKDFLPPTGRVHGRPGKPDSHFWYRVAGLDSHQFKDIKRTGPDGKPRTDMFCEIRSGASHQTVLPPSVHPSGEVLGWSTDREPGAPDARELWRSVTFIGTVCLLARSWPGGNRHFAALHVAGFLCVRKVDEDVILKIVRRAAQLAGDEEVEDRETAARTTIAEFKAGGKTSGGPALAEIMGQETLERLTEWYGGNSSVHDRLVEEMNTDRFMSRLGKDTVYGLELSDGEVVFQKAAALYEEYANQKIKVGEKKKGEEKGAPITKTKFEIWREHIDKRTYRRVVFAPPGGEHDLRDYNLWKGFAVEALLPPPGDPARSSREELSAWVDREGAPKIDKYLGLLRDVICSGNEEHYQYLLKWMAFTCQFPGKPAEVAVALKGEMGSGKGTYAREFGRLFGRHFIHLDRTDQLAGKFNAAISGKVLVFADEAFFGPDKRDLGSLKRLITEPTLSIERKGFDVVQEANCVHLIMATNNEHAHQAAMKERRFFTVRVSDAHLQDHAYFGAVTEQIRGNLPALLSYLMTRIITHDEIRKVPMTDELRIQQEHSLPFELQWWKENLYYGTIADEDWPAEVSGRAVHEDYLRWCDRMKVNRRVTEIDMCRQILRGWLLDERRPVIDGKRVTRRVLLPLVEARKLFDERAGTTSPWPAADEPAPERKPDEPLPF